MYSCLSVEDVLKIQFEDCWNEDWDAPMQVFSFLFLHLE